MRIAVVSNPNYGVPADTGYGGLQRRIAELIEGLLDVGHEVVFYGPWSRATCDRPGLSIAFPGMAPLLASPRAHTMSQTEFRERLTLYAGEVLHDLACRCSLDGILHSFYARSFVERVSSAAKNVPIVAMLGNAKAVDPQPFCPEHIVTALSHAHRHQFSGPNIRVIRPAVTCHLEGHDRLPLLSSRYEPTLPLLRKLKSEGKNYLCHVAGISAFKGQATSIRIAKYLQVPLVLVGPVVPRCITTTSETYYRRHVCPHVDAVTVYYTGALDEGAKNEVLACSLLSLWPAGFERPEWIEPFGRAVAESVLLGTPVLAARGGGHAEFLSNCTPAFLFGDIAEARCRATAAIEKGRPLHVPDDTFPSRRSMAKAYTALLVDGVGGRHDAPE